jgi:hypothetical protein
MADLSQTAASVAASTNAIIDRRFLAGGTITAGMPVYLSAANTWIAADNNVSAVEAGSLGVGIALNGAASGQPVAVQTGGDINIGATLTAGVPYIVSAVAGAVAPITDISTNITTVLGVAISASILRMPLSGPIATGVAHG